MIVLEISDVEQLKKLPIVSSKELRKYLKENHPETFEEAVNLSWGKWGEIEEILEYIVEKENIDNIREVCLPLGAGINVCYGYIID